MEPNSEEDIYFGDKYCFLYPCSGLYRSYKREYIQQDEINKESIAETLKFADDLSYIKPEYKDHYIPVIPETQIHFVNKNLKEDEKENTDFFLSQPFIKCKEIKDYTPCLKCMQSGHRSAIVKDPKTGYYYRLKGCGNDELGFNLLKSEGYMEEYNTRGSQFVSTCSRELYYSEKINEELKKLKIPCANLPVGFWKYDKNLAVLPNEKVKKEDLPVLENKVPEVDKYCGIFRTLGDRRLRTHLLCGIEKLLEKIAQLCINKNVLNDELLNKIKTIYPANRLPNKIETFKTISLFGPDESQPFDEWCKTPVYDKAKYDAIISCTKLKKEIKENKDLQLFLEQSEKYEELFPLLTDGISEKHKKMIRTLLDKLIEDQKKGKKFFGSLLDIYARIGYEVGRIKKRLQEAHINWGSYIDRGFDYHCNAHSNNLVILPQGNDSLLAPLDFDLAFSKEKMIMIYKEAQTFGQHDETYWDNYINAEFVDLSLNLCGSEDFNFAFEKNKKNQDSLEIRIRNTIKYLLCDCMLENYMKGFDNIPSEDVIDNNKLKEDSFLHNIVKLALISTADDVA
jgi:hypothetical protein